MNKKELKKALEEKIGQKVILKPNKSYTAVWIKIKKEDHLILCYFKGKKKERLCLPWSTVDLSDNNNLPVIISEFLAFKKRESISKNISRLEKQLKEKGLI